MSFLAAMAVLTVVLAGVHVVMRPDPGQRNFEIFTEMVYSKAYESYSPNPNFPDGKTLQPLVAGVVPRGQIPFLFGEGAEEAVRAGEVLVSPLPLDERPHESGSRLYAIYCLVCHDARGTGTGPVVLRGMLPPPSLHADRALQMKDGEMFHIVTRGQGNMAAYASQLDERERWLVIQHVRSLQQEGL
jgi:mono/diheme cytochrome c family protein